MESANAPNSQQTLSRRNFVTESTANLRHSKRQSSLVELEQTLEVDENTLRGLRA